MSELLSKDVNEWWEEINKVIRNIGEEGPPPPEKKHGGGLKCRKK